MKTKKSVYIFLMISLAVSSACNLATALPAPPAPSSADAPPVEINSFEACAQSGYSVMESYPRKCQTPDGQIFVEEVEISTPESSETPYYFIAIHNEPWHEPSHTHGGEARIAEEYAVLEQIVARADEYNIKLTLMLSAQWSDYIVDNGKLEDISAWESNGHEIALHHHSIYHGNWDGYTNYPEDTAVQKRIEKKGPANYEAYLGTLDDLMGKVNRLNPAMNSGCTNAESDTFSMPDEIVYDTCSGYANFGKARRLPDGDPEKGRNDYVLSFDVNGIQRYWLAHYQLYQGSDEAKEVFDKLDGNQAYGGVIHSFEDQAEYLYDFMEFLHEKDPTAERSKTVSEIIEQGLLPINTMSGGSSASSGDMVCTQEYRPVCGAVEVTCVAAPCDPIERTFGNMCELERSGAEFLYEGECAASVPPQTIDFPLGMHGAGTRPQNMTPGALFDYQNALDLGIAWDRSFFRSSDYPFDQAAQDLSDGIVAQVPASMQKVLNIYSPREHGSMKLSISDQAFYDYVTQIVERYDGDGMDDMPGLIAPVKYWQVDNEAPGYLFLNVDGMEQKHGDEYVQQLEENWEYYANTFEIAARAIKDACPDCKILMSGLVYSPLHYADLSRKAQNIEDRGDIITLRYFYTPVLERLNGQHVDIFDFHLYGDYVDARMMHDEVEAVLQQSNFHDTEIWITEVGNAGAYTFETAQAIALPKLMIFPIVHGVEKVFWFNMVDMHNEAPMGLVHDGIKDRDIEDPGYGVKKLSYYTYQLLIDQLGNADWNNIETIVEANGTYVYKFIKLSGEPVWVAWSDNGGSITLTGIDADSVQITRAVPKYETGQQVTDFTTAFDTRMETVHQGEVTIILDGSPIFIEE